MKSDVYFAKIDPNNKNGRLSALKSILANAGDFVKFGKDEIVPIKLTIGDQECVYHIPPVAVSEVVAFVKSKGAKPFLFDTCVIYKGSRQNAVDHMNLAEAKGFGAAETGAPFIIADGLLGQDGAYHETEAGHIKKARLPSFIGMLDSLIVLSHATGHIVSGYAGAVKNVAMGMSCRPTKQVQHSSVKPSVKTAKCASCGLCIKICPASAISLKNGKAFIDGKKCLGCGECLCACKFDAISVNWAEDPLIFSRRMAEVAKLILGKFKNKFFINFAFDITRECDCISNKSEKMISAENAIFASFDPLALDKATADASYEKRTDPYLEKTKYVYEELFDHGYKIGLGNAKYDLIKI